MPRLHLQIEGRQIISCSAITYAECLPEYQVPDTDPVFSLWPIAIRYTDPHGEWEGVAYAESKDQQFDAFVAISAAIEALVGPPIHVNKPKPVAE